MDIRRHRQLPSKTTRRGNPDPSFNGVGGGDDRKRLFEPDSMSKEVLHVRSKDRFNVG